MNENLEEWGVLSAPLPKLHIFPGAASLCLFMCKAPLVERVFDMNPLPDRTLDAQVYPWDEAEYKVGPDAKGRFWWLTLDGRFCQIAPYCQMQQDEGWYGEIELKWAFRQRFAARFEQAPWVKLDPPAEWIK